MIMRTTIGKLRRFILREFGLDADMRNMAGSMMDLGGSSDHRDLESSVLNAPPGLGDDREREDDNDYGEQTKNQPGVRVADRIQRVR